MRYSDLDVITSVKADNSIDKHKNKMGELDVNCNEEGSSEVLDNCSVSDGECSTERSSLMDNKLATPDKHKKPKKRVMFKCGDNLVMIREIPPREPTLESETSEESCQSDSPSESSESESEESDESCDNKPPQVKPVRKPTINARVARIIREAPLEIKQKDTPLKRPKKRLPRKPKKEQVSKENTQTKTVEKVSLKPKQIQLKAPEKEPQKSLDSKLTKAQIRRKKVIPVNRIDSPVLKCNNQLQQVDCKNSKIVLSERLKRKPQKSLLERRERESPRISSATDHITEQCVISELSGPDDRPLSQSDKRLYSWLLANGQIPGPGQQSPCISPMWDSKQSGFIWDAKVSPHSNNSVVKAPT